VALRLSHALDQRAARQDLAAHHGPGGDRDRAQVPRGCQLRDLAGTSARPRTGGRASDPRTARRRAARRRGVASPRTTTFLHAPHLHRTGRHRQLRQGCRCGARCRRSASGPARSRRNGVERSAGRLTDRHDAPGVPTARRSPVASPLMPVSFRCRCPGRLGRDPRTPSRYGGGRRVRSARRSPGPPSTSRRSVYWRRCVLGEHVLERGAAGIEDRGVLAHGKR
jgi:hypothetical protein